jgi:ABC-2 type transport system ATP-binding protein
MLRLERLTKRFGSVMAVDELSLDVQPGVVTGFLGPNGAGKTTTMRMVLGLVTPTAGHATINGHRYAALPRPTDVVGAVLDRSNLHPARTGRDHLLLYARLGGHPPSRVDEVLTLVGAGSYADRVARGLSTGMRQRLNLATALLGDPEVLLLDEPTNGLDPEGIAWLRGFLKDLAGQGRTVFVSSHVLSEVEQQADHVVVIRDGRLVLAGDLAVLTQEASLEDTYLAMTR